MLLNRLLIKTYFKYSFGKNNINISVIEKSEGLINAVLIAQWHLVSSPQVIAFDFSIHSGSFLVGNLLIFVHFNA